MDGGVFIKRKNYKTAIYCRLSRDDGDKNESNSIIGQKAFCAEFVSKKEDLKLEFLPFTDDGYSGINFNRPSFIKMFTEIQKGNIDCVVVRDLSRFSRNYIDAGRYLEKIFPSLGVRFIAINDNYDSLNSDYGADSFILPFKNLINDAYCKDISVKIRSSLEIKRKKGEFTSAFTVFGYKKDENNHNKLVIDKEASEKVKMIYSLYKDGLSIGKIANKLNELGILSPFEYKFSKGIVSTNYFKTNPIAKWEYTSVKRILTDEVYIGILAQGKTSTPNCKVRISQKVNKNEWIKVENAHEPIICHRDFFAIQKLLSRDMRYTNQENEINILSGFVFCSDCGNTMIRKKRKVKDKVYYYFVCSTYIKNRKCSTHNISKNKVEQSVFNAIKNQIEIHTDLEKNFIEINRRILLSLVDKIKIHEKHGVEILFAFKDNFKCNINEAYLCLE